MKTGIFKELRDLLKPCADMGFKIQNEVKEVMNKMSKMSDAELDRKYKELQIKSMYISSIAIQLQIQQMEHFVDTVEDETKELRSDE